MNTSTITPDQSIDDLESKRRLALALSIAAQKQLGPSVEDTPEDPTPDTDAPKTFSLPDQQTPQPSDRVTQLRQQADAIPASGVEPVTNWKQALMNVATKVLPVALAGRFGGVAAGAGAARGELTAADQAAADQQNRRTQLLQEAQRQSQQDQVASEQSERQREFNLENQQRVTQGAAEAQRAQSDLAEKQREFNLQDQERNSQATELSKRTAAEEALKQLELEEKKREFNLKQNKLPKETGTFSLAEDGQGNPVLFNSKTGGVIPAPAGLHKPNTEESKRADMAENLSENLDRLQDIVKRRPELFGPVGGRETQVRMALGSNDPDVAALKTIKDQVGMAQQSAHGMRNAQHVETAANSILNNFVNGPDAINSSITTARGSLKTFTNDVQQGNAAIPKGNSAAPKATHRYNPATGKIEPI